MTHTPIRNIAIRRATRGRFEGARKMKFTETRSGGKLRHRDFILQVSLNEVQHPLQSAPLEPRPPLAGRRSRG